MKFARGKDYGLFNLDHIVKYLDLYEF